VLVLDEAENLIWTLLDDHLDEASSARLAKLLEEHEAVRQRYIECVQLHLDLQDHFVDQANKLPGAKATAVPLNLSPGVPGSDASVAQS
jgi:hypothetical protein